MVFPKWKYKALDLSEWGRKPKKDEVVEVGPAVEYFDVGIVIDEQFNTSLKGLFAAGECTLGLFGANRVFSAITEMLVHGADAGAVAADYTLSVNGIKPDEGAFRQLQEIAEKPLDRRKGANPAHVRRHIQEAAHACLGPIRTKAEMEQLLDLLGQAKHEHFPNLAVSSPNPAYNKEWFDTLELANIVLLLEAATRSALARTESRGVHFREDHPDTDNDNWLRESIVRFSGENMEVKHRPITVTSMPPPSGQLPYLDFVKQMMEAHSNTGGKH